MRADEDKTFINPMVAENIDFKKPEDGEIVLRMIQLAKERNIDYQPSYDMKLALNSYLDRKGIPDPLDLERIPAQQYNPGQGFSQEGQPPSGPPNFPPGPPPPNMPPGGGDGGNFAAPMQPPAQYNQQ
mmetsp:Transcript_19240/g.29500  ORF Transcript_19240/g.29500 Transcript_19240/m.29500 type:complete len:128 (-) Transcript_19240:321-704(-)